MKSSTRFLLLDTENQEAGDPYVDYLLYDSFEDDDATILPDHTPEKDSVGSGWSDVTAGITIESDKASDNQADRLSVIPVGTGDVVLEADCVVNNGNFFGVCFRYQDGTHFIIAGCDVQFNKTTCWLNNGGWSKLGEKAHTYNNGDVFTIRVETDDTSIVIYIDDVEELNLTQAALKTAQSVGLYGDGSTFVADSLWDIITVKAN